MSDDAKLTYDLLGELTDAVTAIIADKNTGVSIGHGLELITRLLPRLQDGASAPLVNEDYVALTVLITRITELREAEVWEKTDVGNKLAASLSDLLMHVRAILYQHGLFNGKSIASLGSNISALSMLYDPALIDFEDGDKLLRFMDTVRDALYLATEDSKLASRAAANKTAEAENLLQQMKTSKFAEINSETLADSLKSKAAQIVREVVTQNVATALAMDLAVAYRLYHKHLLSDIRTRYGF